MKPLAISLHPTHLGTHILSSENRPCPDCRQLTMWFVNAGGRSTCVRCAVIEPALKARTGSPYRGWSGGCL